MRRFAPIGLVVACALLAACGNEQVDGTASPPQTSRAPGSTPAGTPPADPAPTSAYTDHFDDGIHQVGMDVMPGTYATGPALGQCFWKRVDVMGHLIQDGLSTHSPRPVTVTILPTDNTFFSMGCGQWHHVQ